MMSGQQLLNMQQAPTLVARTFVLGLKDMQRHLQKQVLSRQLSESFCLLSRRKWTKHSKCTRNPRCSKFHVLKLGKLGHRFLALGSQWEFEFQRRSN
jgi:hypothetical protein